MPPLPKKSRFLYFFVWSSSSSSNTFLFIDVHHSSSSSFWFGCNNNNNNKETLLYSDLLTYPQAPLTQHTSRLCLHDSKRGGTFFFFFLVRFDCHHHHHHLLLFCFGIERRISYCGTLGKIKKGDDRMVLGSFVRFLFCAESRPTRLRRQWTKGHPGSQFAHFVFHVLFTSSYLLLLFFFPLLSVFDRFFSLLFFYFKIQQTRKEKEEKRGGGFPISCRKGGDVPLCL